MEQSVLVDAIDEADLWDLFGSFERAALIELGENQNLEANLALLGDKEPVEAVIDDIADLLLVVSRSLPQKWQMPVVVLAGTWRLMRIFEGRIDTLTRAVSGLEPSSVPEDEVSRMMVLVAQLGGFISLLPEEVRSAFLDDIKGLEAILDRL